MDSKIRLQIYREWLVDLNDREEEWIKTHPEDSETALAVVPKIPRIEVREIAGFWEVLLDGRMVFGSSSQEAQQEAQKKAKDILKDYGVEG